MAIGKREVSQRGERTYRGLDRYGAIVESTVPVENKTTEYVRMMIREIQAKYMSPKEIAEAWLASDYADSAGHCVRLLWLHRDRFCDWAGCPTGNSAEATVVYGWGSPWASDENRWTGLCDAAEGFSRVPSRFQVAREALQRRPVQAFLTENDLGFIREVLERSQGEQENRKGPA